MGQKNCKSNHNSTEHRVKRVKPGSKSNKSNYKFYTKILKQNIQIVQIKYIYKS